METDTNQAGSWSGSPAAHSSPVPEDKKGIDRRLSQSKHSDYHSDDDFSESRSMNGRTSPVSHSVIHIHIHRIIEPLYHVYRYICNLISGGDDFFLILRTSINKLRSLDVQSDPGTYTPERHSQVMDNIKP